MSQQAVVSNLLLNYTRAGEHGGKTLLFLHGWRSNKEVWGGVNQLISKSVNQSINYYALDLPGFGGSQLPSVPMAGGDYAEVVAGFIGKLDLKNVIVVGHSFGGRVGIKLAANYPQLVGKLVLVDSAGFVMDSSKKSFMNAAAKIIKPLFKPKVMQPLRQKIYRSIGAEDYLATPQLQKTFVKITSEDLSEDLKKIGCPTLIITGENDKDTPLEFGERMNSLIQNSKFKILPNAGHFSFLDKPEEFVTELINFI